MKTKVYCIIKKGDFFYFPVKAKTSPYLKKSGEPCKQYQAGMPNLFGGTGDSENKFLTLEKEVKEESQDKISIKLYDAGDARGQNHKIEGACTMHLYHTTVEEKGENVDYDFYLFDGDQYAEAVTEGITIADFGEANRLELSTAAVPPNAEPGRREMACILKIPKDRLPDNIDGFLDLCIAMGGNFLFAKDRITAHRDWKDEGTRNAFEEFCRRYGHH